MNQIEAEETIDFVIDREPRRLAILSEPEPEQLGFVNIMRELTGGDPYPPRAYHNSVETPDPPSSFDSARYMRGSTPLDNRTIQSDADNSLRERELEHINRQTYSLQNYITDSTYLDLMEINRQRYVPNVYIDNMEGDQRINGGIVMRRRDFRRVLGNGDAFTRRLSNINLSGDFIPFNDVSRRDKVEFTIGDIELSKEEHECCICMEEKLTDNMCQLNCCHKFCISCIDQHLERNNKCPLCREKVDKIVCKTEEAKKQLQK